MSKSRGRGPKHGGSDLPFELPDRRAMEGVMARMTRRAGSQEFESIEELNAFLQAATLRGDQPVPPRNPVEHAQDVMYEAFEARGPRRVQLAREALAISPDCADAYVLLAEETATTAEEARDLYAQGVEAGRRALGPEIFEEEAGNFWGILETRPYMRAQAGLAEAYEALRDFETAAAIYEELLRLNPNDNQGNRCGLLRLLAKLDRDEQLRELLDRFPEDGRAEWRYTKALVLFRQSGASLEATIALDQALNANRHVPFFLSGYEKIPDQLPATSFTLGDRTEAIYYTLFYARTWMSSPGSIELLVQRFARTMKRDTGRALRPETLIDIVADLEAPVYWFPTAALEEATRRRDEVTPYLLEILERGPAAIRNHERSKSHLFAMFLLAQFREPRALEPMVRFLVDADDEDETLNVLFGDVLSEDVSRLLASVSGGETGPIRHLVEDPDRDEFIRGAALEALVAMVGAGLIERDEVVAYFRELLEGKLEPEAETVRAFVVHHACELGATELWDPIAAAFEAGLVDESFIDAPFTKQLMEANVWTTREQLVERHSRYLLVDDAIAELNHWIESVAPPPPPAPRAAGPPAPSRARAKAKAKNKRKAARKSRRKNR